MIVPNNDSVIALLLQYGDVIRHKEGKISFMVPGTNYWYHAHTGSILNVVQDWMEDAVLDIESEK